MISAPEQGEGGNSNVYYEPLVESMQEFKVENNSFSAEFGNNGGTVVNMVMKSGTNAFHGTGWYFLQRPQMDARDFFNPAPSPKPDSKRDQGGFSIGGPILKNRTFFFADFEKVRFDSATSNVVSVPTMDERTGNFSTTANLIYDPTQPLVAVPTATGQCRPLVQGNIIPGNEIDLIGRAVLNLYPKPTNGDEFNNFNLALRHIHRIVVRHQGGPQDQRQSEYQRSPQPRPSNFYTSESPETAQKMADQERSNAGAKRPFEYT